MSDEKNRARAFLAGARLSFEAANELWKVLKKQGELSFARRVLEWMRDGDHLLKKIPVDFKTKRTLCQQEALLTSKDEELSVATRHDLALAILADFFCGLDNPALDSDGETLGIAGGIVKRRWIDLGQTEDLRRAESLYQRGAKCDFGDDAYPHINAAFLEDLLAQIGDDPIARKARARSLRERILEKLPVSTTWFNAATRAEALFGLGRHPEATLVVASCSAKPAPWELETTARQIASIAHMQVDDPMRVPEIRDFFNALLPGAAGAVQSAVAGRIGLALSGGGFRASFYHLGVLARLAELDVLRRVDVLSCVSGGSIVGMCYWLALRQRLLDKTPMQRADYIQLVKSVTQRFLDAVAIDLRGQVQPAIPAAIWGLLRGNEGVLDPEKTARALEDNFYRPLFPSSGRPFMHELEFTPADHNPSLTNCPTFNAGRDNWLRADKVPMLVINATTINTGHAWQFTPTWMGEAPWAIHEAADSIPRLEWSWYHQAAGWRIELGRAVAASACVPGIFTPLELTGYYPNVTVQLVDGGVHDNQGVVSLLAHNCNVLLVSDACGQLLFQQHPTPGLKGLASYAKRSMDTLMERVRLATFGDLEARRQSGLLRGLMFQHMKAGLDADTVRLGFSQESYELHREVLSPSGVRKDFQQALAELRTDLDAFSLNESHALMACGYQMCCWSFERDLASLKELSEPPITVEWSFKELLEEITSTEANTARREPLLAELREGSRVRLR